MKAQNVGILMLICLILSYSNICYANGAKPWEDPNNDGLMYFSDDTNIKLQSESISFDVQEVEGHGSKAIISVKYVMKNLGDQQRFQMYFVIPHSDTYSVKLNDVEITNKTEMKELPHIENWKPNRMNILEPYSKKEISGLKDNPTLYGIVIPLEFETNGWETLEIVYSTESGYFNADHLKHTVYSFVYYLTPANFWEEEVDMKLSIKFPEYGKYKIHSNIGLEPKGKNLYETHLSKLPDEEFVISFVDSDGLIFNTNLTKVHSRYVVICTLALMFVSVLVRIVTMKKFVLIVGYIITNLFLFRFLGKIVDGYIIDAFTYLSLVVILWFLVPLTALIRHIYMKNKRKRITTN